MNKDALGTSASQHMLGITAEIVAAYVGRNAVPSGELSNLIRAVHSTLHEIGNDGPPAVALKPHVAASDSITDDYLVCLEDGLRFKSLKRHLRSKYGLTPDAYREKWGLPSDYPMVAPAYARRRSELAKEMGLGRGSN